MIFSFWCVKGHYWGNNGERKESCGVVRMPLWYGLLEESLESTKM